MLCHMYTACLFYCSCVMFSVVFGEGRMLTASEAYPPNFYKPTELNFSYFPNVEGSFFSRTRLSITEHSQANS